jgi:hypothetical protein
MQMKKGSKIKKILTYFFIREGGGVGPFVLFILIEIQVILVLIVTKILINLKKQNMFNNCGFMMQQAHD